MKFNNESFLVTFRGEKLNVELIKSKRFDERKTVVFLHGFSSSPLSYLNFLTYLSKKYNVVAPYLPGHGSSKYTHKLMDTSLVELSEWLNNVLFQLELTSNNIILCGHSFGGALAIAFAKKYPVEKLRLIDPVIEKINLYSILNTWYGLKATILFIVNTKRIPYLGNILNNLRNRKSLLQISGVLKNLNIISDLSKVKSDTFIYWGERDKLTNTLNANILLSHIKIVNLIIMKGLDHSCFVYHTKYFEDL